MRVASRREPQRIHARPALPALLHSQGPTSPGTPGITEDDMLSDGRRPARSEKPRRTAANCDHPRPTATNRSKQEKPDTRSGFRLLPRLDSNQ